MQPEKYWSCISDAFETAPRRAIQKTEDAISDLIGNKTINKITKVLKTSPQNNSETVTNEEEILERYVLPEKRHYKSLII